jgi:ankyrin repeat protein
VCRVTTLHIAAETGNLEALNALIVAGADVNSQNDRGYIMHIYY